MQAPDSPLPPKERLKILLAEDDPGVRRSLQLLLQARGFDVRAFAMGATLLADPESLRAACLVTGYRMAGLDGLAILARLRAQGWRGASILITGHPSPAMTERATAGGFDAVIEKPFREPGLADAVVRLLTARGGGGSSSGNSPA